MPGPELRFQPPMLASPAEAPPAGDEWLHELHHEGLRLQLLIEQGTARAFSSDGEDRSDSFRPICKAAAALTVQSAIIDGVVTDSDGSRLLVAFDLLHLNGGDLRGAPVEQRRALLAELLPGGRPERPIQFSDHVSGAGEEFLAAVEGTGLKGIVSKRRGSRYRAGRSRD